MEHTQPRILVFFQQKRVKIHILEVCLRTMHSLHDPGCGWRIKRDFLVPLNCLVTVTSVWTRVFLTPAHWHSGNAQFWRICKMSTRRILWQLPFCLVEPQRIPFLQHSALTIVDRKEIAVSFFLIQRICPLRTDHNCFDRPRELFTTEPQLHDQLRLEVQKLQK